MATIKPAETDGTLGSSDRAAASGAYSNSAITIQPPGNAVRASMQERLLSAKIARAMLSGPRQVTKDITIPETILVRADEVIE